MHFRAELSTFFSQLEELKEYSSVLNRATEDAGSLALGRLNVIQEKGLQVVQAIQTQTVRVNGLLDYYEAAVWFNECLFFVLLCFSLCSLPRCCCLFVCV